MILSLLFLSTIPKESDRDYMQRLFEEHYSLMLAAARKITRQNQDVDEIVSESLMALYEKIDRLRQFEHNELRLYIVSTVRNTAVNVLKRNKRMNMRFLHVPDEVVNQAPGRENTEQKVILIDEFNRVSKAIYALPERERLVMQFKFEMGKSNEEVAEAMGISTESVRRYINRARAHIRQILYQEETEHREDTP